MPQISHPPQFYGVSKKNIIKEINADDQKKVNYINVPF
jgi:hypothetical protein